MTRRERIAMRARSRAATWRALARSARLAAVDYQRAGDLETAQRNTTSAARLERGALRFDRIANAADPVEPLPDTGRFCGVAR